MSPPCRNIYKAENKEGGGGRLPICLWDFGMKIHVIIIFSINLEIPSAFPHLDSTFTFVLMCLHFVS